MSDVIHLADPDFEPTDAQLIALGTRAFAALLFRGRPNGAGTTTATKARG